MAAWRTAVDAPRMLPSASATSSSPKVDTCSSTSAKRFIASGCCSLVASLSKLRKPSRPLAMKAAAFAFTSGEKGNCLTWSVVRSHCLKSPPR